MTDDKTLVARLRAACDGHPHAKIPWPHRVLHEAADRIEALEAERQWRPIETAPKPEDRGSFLVYCAERRNTYVVCWWQDFFGGSKPYLTHFGGGLRAIGETPTHWMPLPQPPGDGE